MQIHTHVHMHAHYTDMHTMLHYTHTYTHCSLICHIQAIPHLLTGYAVPIIVSLVIFLVFYGGAFLGVLFFDFFLLSSHWMYPWIREWNRINGGDDALRGSSSGESDFTDNGDVERTLTTPRTTQQENRTHYMYSTNFKRRPSLKKVVVVCSVYIRYMVCIKLCIISVSWFIFSARVTNKPNVLTCMVRLLNICNISSKLAIILQLLFTLLFI